MIEYRAKKLVFRANTASQIGLYGKTHSFTQIKDCEN